MRSKRKSPGERLLFSRKEKVRRREKSDNVLGIKDIKLENAIFKNRMIIAIMFSVLLGVILFANIYYLQIVSYDSYTTRSNENRIKVLPVVPQRGIIYDRNHVVLAENRPVFHLTLFPVKGVDTKDAIEKLNDLLKLELDEAEINNLLHLARTRQRFSGLELSRHLTEDQIATFSVNRHRFPNVQITSNLNRHYPFANILTHALGYVSRINQDDLDLLMKEGKLENYEGTQSIGKLGIERYYEDILHGTPGSREVEVDSHGRVIRTLNYNPPSPGLDITLTIDIRLQYYAQELLGSMRGAIAAIDPSTGEILAFYSNPSYDPNLFVRGIRSNEYKRLLNNPSKPLINRVTQGGYSPASTIKPLLAIMGLNEGLITRNSTYFGGPAFMLPGSSHRFRDWKAWGHGWLDIYRAIEVSADTYFYDLAHRAGIDTIHSYLDRFGFGRATGIDIKEESLGLNPSKEWKLRRHGDSWHLGDTIPIGIGQGYWVSTLMQLIKAHAALANYGQTITPHFLEKATDPSQNNAQVLNFADILRARDEGNISNLRLAIRTPDDSALSLSMVRTNVVEELEENEEIMAADHTAESTASSNDSLLPSPDVDNSSLESLDPDFVPDSSAVIALESLGPDTAVDLMEDPVLAPEEAFQEKFTDPDQHIRQIHRHPLAQGPDSTIMDVKDPSYWDVARAGMYLVINGPEGTGRRAFANTGYKAAGKCGTAQLVSIAQNAKYNAGALKEIHRDNALFVAFAPYKYPRILVAVILENEGGGSAKAAPIARKLMDKYLLELYPGGYLGESSPVVEKFGLGGTVSVQ